MTSPSEEVFSLQPLRQGISELWVGIRKELGENVSVVPPRQLVCWGVTQFFSLWLTLAKSLDAGGESPDGVGADIVSLRNEMTKK